MNFYNNILEVVGNTPLVKLNKIVEGIDANILVKLEMFNPLASVKDRAALNMVENYEKEGKIKPGVTRLIEPTSGNTGIGLAMVSAVKGYKLTIIMPETMSLERRALILALGAELILTPGSKGMNGAVCKANDLVKSDPNAIIVGQFDNPANAEAHYKTTGPEIWKDTDGKIDYFISAIGTGGTVTGVGKYLKEKNPNIKIIGVEPTESNVLTGGTAHSHGIQGIGAGFIPKVLDRSVLDEVITISTPEALSTAKELVTKDGIMAGISSGCAVAAAKVIASRPENKGKMVVALCPDYGERYLSTPLFEEENKKAATYPVTE